MAVPCRSAILLDRIAAALGVPVEVFTAPAALASPDTAPAAHIATLVFDPDGCRFAAAFVDLPPQGRKALADGAEALRAGFAADRQRRDGGQS
ncbi:hypothetical protein MKK75_03240 [Methylobacterium sp. J-030]|uniref:hypothetical protein n=1 Tax=Methylobacterium sp. J-030 TaxID=2836627 RepID=UPI001FBB36D1|nr:hypothetical protein [Methylobacterium sp. J-030]MCJ2067831.1 hypothetical protein [Methylobacterium sp. J-030]